METGHGERVQVERYAALEALGGVMRHGFVGRVKGVGVGYDKAGVLAELAPWHGAVVRGMGYEEGAVVTAEQVHGAEVAVVGGGGERHVAGVDGLITAERGVVLGIHVADCAPVWVVDPASRVLAVLHSGRKSTEGNIVGGAIREMVERFGCDPGRMVVQIGPAIRPPWFEMDIPARIREDAVAAGVDAAVVHDCGICTHASDPERYYSYRREKGCTGRMVALGVLC
jgi:copper oxidase (laccase) domain-containing protein